MLTSVSKTEAKVRRGLHFPLLLSSHRLSISHPFGFITVIYTEQKFHHFNVYLLTDFCLIYLFAVLGLNQNLMHASESYSTEPPPGPWVFKVDGLWHARCCTTSSPSLSSRSFSSPWKETLYPLSSHCHLPPHQPLQLLIHFLTLQVCLV